MISEICFWQKFEQNHYLFCEEQLCGYITEPANTWSNIGYLIVAILILKSRNKEHRIRLYFFWAMLALFLGSSLFHATSTYWGKFADVSAMFFLSVTILSLALERFYKLNRRYSVFTFVFLITGSLSFLYIMRFGHLLFASQLVISAWLEWKMVLTKVGIDLSKLKLAVATFIAGFMIWLLDVYKILCVPGNHILTGHGVWHLLSAVTIWVFYNAYKNAPAAESK